MSKSNLVAFRVPADLQDAFNQAVAASGGDKSAWLVDALRSKLNRPVADSDKRLGAGGANGNGSGGASCQ